MKTRERLPLISLVVFITLLFANASITLAQHEPASGGGTIGGGSISTGRPTNKPTNKPANKPTSTSTKPTTRPTTSSTTGNRPTSTTGNRPTSTTGNRPAANNSAADS